MVSSELYNINVNTLHQTGLGVFSKSCHGGEDDLFQGLVFQDQHKLQLSILFVLVAYIKHPHD